MRIKRDALLGFLMVLPCASKRDTKRLGCIQLLCGQRSRPCQTTFRQHIDDSLIVVTQELGKLFFQREPLLVALGHKFLKLPLFIL